MKKASIACDETSTYTDRFSTKQLEICKMTRGVAKQSFPTLPQQASEQEIASKPRLTVRIEYVSVVNAATQPVCLGFPEYRTSLVGDLLNGSAAGF